MERDEGDDDAPEQLNQVSREHENSKFELSSTWTEHGGRSRPTGRPAVERSALVAPGRTLGHYEVIRDLGQGSTGTVFLARDIKLGRLVAIKLLHERSGARDERFLVEARATARCRHPNIVVIHEVDEIDGCPYMVLEYLEGQTLRVWMSQRGLAAGPARGAAPAAPPVARPVASPVASPVVTVARAVEIMAPVVRALVCAHELGIVHRDLKPENIILDGSGVIKVLDFSIAEVLGADEISALAREDLDAQASMARARGISGTAPYMSPEQWGAADIDHRSDIWAVGIMLHELVTGAHPLAPLSLDALMQVANLDVPMPSVRQRRPDLGPLAGIIDRCLRKHKHERTASAAALLAELEPLLPGVRAFDLGEDGNPFAGLAAFQESDAPRFFGRDREIASMAARLRNHRLLAVAGASGAGKSSLVRAGLIPALKRSGERWEAYILRPGRSPLGALAEVLVQASTDSSTDIATDIATASSTATWPDADSRALVELLRSQPGYLGARLRALCRRGGHRILLFIDQFEELYTLGADRDQRAAFVACLEGVADDAASPLRVILAIRSDFLDRVADDRELVARVTDGLALLPPMGPEGLRHALTHPIEAAGYRFESADMVESMLDSLDTTRSPLPLLQFTAAKLWDARDRRRKLITRASHDELGGVAGALSTHADAVLAGMSARERSLARAVLLRLVTPERTRAVVSTDELAELADDSVAVVEVMLKLAEARLVLIETGTERGGSTVELVHESLIDRWPRLGRWLEQSEQDARFLARLRSAASEWEASDRAEGLLWRGRAAQDARRWLLRQRAENRARPWGDAIVAHEITDQVSGGYAAGEHELAEPALDHDADEESNDETSGGHAIDAGLGKREERYLLAVVSLADRSRRQRWRLAVAGFAALGAIAVILTFLAVRANREAARANREAARADQEAALVNAQKAALEREAMRSRNATRMAVARELQSDPTTVIALVREVEPVDVPRGWATLARWAMHTGVAEVVLPHPGIVWRAEISPDGARIVTASADRMVRIWAADGSGEPRVVGAHDDGVLSAGFSPDGARVVTASADGTARVWTADGSGEPVVLRGHGAAVYSARFSPDGARVVTASADGSARLWNADGSGEPVVLRGHGATVFSARFSPDGARVVTASADGTARLWQADGTGAPRVLRGHGATVFSAGFSPDGARVVTASADGTARLWQADGKGAPRIVGRHDDAVLSAGFSPDGRRVVTASLDRTARIWAADGDGAPLTFRGHGDRVWMAEFSADGARVVTASADNTVRVWDARGAGRPVVLGGHGDAVLSAAFSADGARIATASMDRSVRVWNASGAGEPWVVRGHGDVVTSVAFSPDGARIVTASLDGLARIWTIGSTDRAGQHPRLLRGHGDGVHSAEFSPDGTRVVTASSDGTARLWNLADGAATVLRGHQAAVYSAAFSPDGARVVTASADRTVRIWTVDGSADPVILRGHGDRVYSAAFDAVGARVVTASADQTVRVWSADGSGEEVVLRGHEAWVWKAAFSPDGRRIVSASKDQTVRVWSADGSGEPLVLRGHEHQVNSARFSPNGRRIVTASDDRTARVWSDIEPLDPDHPRLWSATAYCMPVESRKLLLGVSEATARQNRADCLRRVARARRARAAPSVPPAP